MPFMGMAGGASPSLTNGDITTGTATTPALITAAQAKLAVNTFRPRFSILSTDTSAEVATSTAYSITRTTHADATELFIVPANTLAADGDTIELMIGGAALNNDGASRSLLLGTVTYGGQVIMNGGGVTLAASATGPRGFELGFAITRISSTTAWLRARASHGSASADIAAVAGDSIGIFGGGFFTSAQTKAFPLTPGSAATFSVTMNWDVASGTFYFRPHFRMMRLM